MNNSQPSSRLEILSNFFNSGERQTRFDGIMECDLLEARGIESRYSGPMEIAKDTPPRQGWYTITSPDDRFWYTFEPRATERGVAWQIQRELNKGVKLEVALTSGSKAEIIFYEHGKIN